MSYTLEKKLLDEQNAVWNSYTVTIAGPERHDGESPYVYALHARSLLEAYWIGLGFFQEEYETTDVVVEGVSLGVPGDNCGFFWNDLRG